MTERLAILPKKTSCQISSELGEVTRVRQFCRMALDTFGQDHVGDDTKWKLELAISEVVTNVIQHGYGGRPDESITCVVEVDSQRVQADVWHHGKRFEGMVPAPRMDGPQESGMGLYLIEQCVDQVLYCQIPDGRQFIRLTIHIT